MSPVTAPYPQPQLASSNLPLSSLQLEHTTLPKREHGHKQLGKAAAVAHIAQLLLFFTLGAAMLGLAAPQLPGQARVANATFGILYALQVHRGAGGWLHALQLGGGAGVPKQSEQLCLHAPRGMGSKCTAFLAGVIAQLMTTTSSTPSALHTSGVSTKLAGRQAGPGTHVPWSIQSCMQPSPAMCPFAFPAQATKLIMAHMAKEPYEVTAWPLVLLAVQASCLCGTLEWWQAASGLALPASCCIRICRAGGCCCLCPGVRHLVVDGTHRLHAVTQHPLQAGQ